MSYRRLLAVAGSLLLLQVVLAQAPEAYQPVAPPQALQAVLQANLKQARDWLGDRDFASAAETAQGLAALAQVYTYQSKEPAWQKQATALREACAQLGAAARQKDAAACDRAVAALAAVLDDCARQPPTGARASAVGFKPLGGNKTWMLLMDAAYADAKTAREPATLELLALALAEECNAARHLRPDARWRQMAQDVQAAALTVAERARARDLPAAKRELKVVYERCEACHQGYRKR